MPGAIDEKKAEKKIRDTTIRVVKGDITTLEVDGFVYYAQPNLKLGTGWGNAISVRGGPKVQEELNKLGSLKTGEAVASSAGELKAQVIIHAVGPRFQEEETERKLAETVRSALRVAEERGLKQVAFPPMGCGFYGVPLDVSARVMFETIKEHFGKSTAAQTQLSEVIVCVNDQREFGPFASRLAALA